MANIESQKKRNRQNEKQRLRNKAVRSEVKTAVRRVNEAVEAGDADATTEALRVAQQKLGVAARKGVIGKQTMARKQSRLALAANRSAEAAES